MATDPELVLGEFIDAWNAGAEPDVDAYLERVAAPDRDELAAQIADWIEIAPVPAYDAATTARLLADPAASEWLASLETSLLPRLLARARTHARLTLAELGQRFVREAGVAAAGEAKATSYLGQLESGELSPAGVSQRALDALGRMLGIPGADLAAAALPPPPAAAGGALYRARAAPAAAAPAPAPRKALEAELDELADAFLQPSPPRWDEIDELFRGGR